MQADGIPQFIVMMEDDQKKAEPAGMCVDSASAALGLSHDGLSSHRAVLPVPLGAAVNKG